MSVPRGDWTMVFVKLCREAPPAHSLVAFNHEKVKSILHLSAFTRSMCMVIERS